MWAASLFETVHLYVVWEHTNKTLGYAFGAVARIWLGHACFLYRGTLFGILALVPIPAPRGAALGSFPPT